MPRIEEMYAFVAEDSGPDDEGTNLTKYKLSEKGSNFVWATTMEREFTRIPA